MKLICLDEHRQKLEDVLKEYEDIDIVLIEQGVSYEGMGYLFDFENLQAMKDALKELKNQQFLIGYYRERMYLVKVQDIVYIEGLSRSCYFYTKDKEYECQYKLFECEKLLMGTSMMRISKSMMVNICYIDYILPESNMKYGLYMMTGVKLVLSRKYVASFKKKIKMR